MNIIGHKIHKNLIQTNILWKVCNIVLLAILLGGHLLVNCIYRL